MVVHDAERSPKPRPRLEVMLHNTGESRVVINRADIELVRVYSLPRCASQDDVPLSQTYGLTFPAGAKPGQTFEVPLHQQIGPDEVDRFAIGFSATPALGRPGTVELFELRISLRNDGSPASVPLGRVLVALPELPLVGEYFWNAGTPDVLRQFVNYEPAYARYLRRFGIPCWRSNTEQLRSASSGSALRSGLLQSIVGEMVAPDPAVLE